MYPLASVEEHKYSLFLDHLEHFRENLYLTPAPAIFQIIFVLPGFGQSVFKEPVLILLVSLYRENYGRCFEY